MGVDMVEAHLPQVLTHPTLVVHSICSGGQHEDC